MYNPELTYHPDGVSRFRRTGSINMQLLTELGIAFSTWRPSSQGSDKGRTPSGVQCL